ncbi:hypothetical protein NQ317_019283 [Molorchus minor]|uniref:Uncharacterized protein n=1 Tax=Molorchus minor TaxID=1323400 RepID=A0ABQ9J8E3_9CUCU|nr:hypothetical protein NQ317_019283 [Molorchus minor]
MEEKKAEVKTVETEIKVKVAMTSSTTHKGAGPGNGTNQSQQFYPGLPTGFHPQHFHSNIQPGHQVPSSTHLGHSPPPNPTYYKDERTQRQHIKLKKEVT